MLSLSTSLTILIFYALYINFLGQVRHFSFSISKLIHQTSIAGRSSEDKLSAKRDKNHILFGGTKMLQHTPDKVYRIVSFNILAILHC